MKYSDKVAILNEFENAICNRNLTEAMEFFNDDATIQAVNSPYLRSREVDLKWALPEFRVDPVTRAVSPITVIVDYKGKEPISRFVYNLIFLSYKRVFSEFKADADKVIWSGNVAISNFLVQMKYEASFEQDKIQALVITYSNLVLNQS